MSQFGTSGFKSQKTQQKTYAERKHEALVAKNTTILSIDELERIKGMCSQTNQEQDYRTMRLNERKELHKISSTRVSKWPNTIQAERERKEYERIKKLEDDEVSYAIQSLFHFSYFHSFSISTRLNYNSSYKFLS